MNPSETIIGVVLSDGAVSEGPDSWRMVVSLAPWRKESDSMVFPDLLSIIGKELVSRPTSYIEGCAYKFAVTKGRDGQYSFSGIGQELEDPILARAVEAWQPEVIDDPELGRLAFDRLHEWYEGRWTFDSEICSIYLHRSKNDDDFRLACDVLKGLNRCTALSFSDTTLHQAALVRSADSL